MLRILFARPGTVLREAVGEKLCRLHNRSSSLERIGVGRMQGVGANGMGAYGTDIRLQVRE